ncbi:DNA-binding NarL/FixJ family response regulator [Herbihabitans rhizosphaerae]|uniref:DNA-binding NarL/FixJ family response regulator n=1 Tax=Herbihabitans rhizosphaerae TaxID=1872711 RepID=A0A4Q7KLM3_9PSEU|nr:response regulator transcription factor [Herbihabitans rhizosphaerae]RZS36451.1 DNA-binding NarL/FixJ family response regulator [Herbihabitans rhizosphaerae]
MAAPVLARPTSETRQPTQRLRVLAFDALPLSRFGMRTLVDAAADLSWLGSAATVRAAVPMIGRLRPDVVVVHSTLDPNAALARQLTTSFPWLTLVVLVDDRHRADWYVRALRSAGVHGILAPGTAPAVLLTGMRMAHAQRQFVDPDLMSGTKGGGRSTGPLSGRQHEVLTLIAEGYENAEIGGMLFISVETVRSHVKEILKRMRARDRAHAVARGYQTGMLDVRLPSAAGLPEIEVVG